METASTPLLSTDKAAAHLGLRPQTLRVWRVRGCGPPYVRLSGGPRGGRVVYRASDLDAWLAGRTFTSTSAETVARLASSP